MALFKKGQKKKPEPVVEYSEVEQGTAPLPVLPPSPIEAIALKVDKVIGNQQAIVANQQIILDSIGELRLRLEQLATGEPDEEPTPEEIEAAIQAARAAKRGKQS